MNSPHLTTEQLVEKVTQKTAHLDINDGRIANTLTERTVRYYVTIGVVRPPLRDGNTSVWTQDHVNDLIRVRRSQEEGQPLKAVRRMLEMELQHPTRADFWRVENDTAMRLSVARMQPMAIDWPHLNYATTFSDQQHPNGWMVRLSPQLHLSGFGAQLTTDEIDAVREALRDRIGADINSNHSNDKDIQ